MMIENGDDDDYDDQEDDHDDEDDVGYDGGDHYEDQL